jgi:hypothetical protein
MEKCGDGDGVGCKKVSRVDIVGEYRDKCNVNSRNEGRSIAFVE